MEILGVFRVLSVQRQSAAACDSSLQGRHMQCCLTNADAVGRVATGTRLETAGRTANTARWKTNTSTHTNNDNEHRRSIYTRFKLNTPSSFLSPDILNIQP